VAGALASALALGLCARATWPWIALESVALVPWLAAQDRARSWRGALGSAAVFCLAFVLSVFAWFAIAMSGYAATPRWVGFAALVGLAPVLQPQVFAFAAARHALRRVAAEPALTALVGACAWVGAEWALPKLFGDTLGHGLHGSARLRQAADLAGAHGLTLAVLLANDCALGVARALARRPRRLRAALAPAAAGLAISAALAGYGELRLRELRAADGPAVTAGIVQADISHYARLRQQLGTHDAVRGILDAHFALSSEALARAPLDLLLWPETVYPTTFGTPRSEAGAAFDREIGAFVREAGVPLVFGAYDLEDGAEFNATVFLEPAGDGRVEFETYRKTWLFPLTERVPRWLDGPRVRAVFPWLGTWRGGSGPQVVPLHLRDGRTLRAAPLICYDALDPGHALEAVRRGADLIVTLSNDSWFAEGAGPRLHLIVAAFRSIETRRAQLRATNTGISAAIDATGEIRAELGVHARASLVQAFPLGPRPRTLVLAWGDWLPPAALAAAALGLAIALRPRRPAAAARQARRAPRR
jgi:apolipoprotein N-acyltransferase